MNALVLTVVGNLTADPELRFTPSGVALARFTVAHTPRAKRGDEWVDGEPTYLDCTAWRYLAENVAESLAKGVRVVVTGRLRTDRWDDKETGQKRSRMVLDADAVGAELTYATVAVRKMAHRAETSPDDPWATASRERPELVGNGGHDEEPAF